MTDAALTPELLLAHWLGHRRLTRRVIEAFPEDALFGFTLAGMRSFGAMMDEVGRFHVPVLQGAVDGAWRWPARGEPDPPPVRDRLLADRDRDDAALAELLPRVPGARFLEEREPLPGRREPVVATLLYFLDNEIHHRGQGTVYLRALGIEPPPFYRR